MTFIDTSEGADLGLRLDPRRRPAPDLQLHRHRPHRAGDQPHLRELGNLPPLPAGEARARRAERGGPRVCDRRGPGIHRSRPAITVSGTARARPTSPTSSRGSAINCTPAADGAGRDGGGTIAGGRPAADHGLLGHGRHEDGVGDQQRLRRRPGEPERRHQGAEVLPPQASITITPAQPKAGRPARDLQLRPSTGVPVGIGRRLGLRRRRHASGASRHPRLRHRRATTTSILAITPPGCLNTTCVDQATKSVTVAPAAAAARAPSSRSPGLAERVAAGDPRLPARRPTSRPAPSSAGTFGDGSAPASERSSATPSPRRAPTTSSLAIAPPGCTIGGLPGAAAKTVVVGPPPAGDGRLLDRRRVRPTRPASTRARRRPSKPVALTAAAADASSYSWNFGDGKTGSGRQVTHAWEAPGTYTVTLTVAKDASTSDHGPQASWSSARPLPRPRRCCCPWSPRAAVALLQSNDLYVYNPGATPLL